MLDGQWSSIPAGRSLTSAVSGREIIDFRDFMAFFRLYSVSIVLSVVIGLGFAAFYLATTDPTFTARTQILIDPRIPQLLQQQPADVNLSLDTAQIESQIAVLQSEKIAMIVIDELKLVEDPVFNYARTPTMRDRVERLAAVIVDTFGLPETGGFDSPAFPAIGNWLSRWTATVATELPEFERYRLTMETFQNGLGVRRVGVSYAIEISFQSKDPEQSAKTANAVADAYVSEQLETRATAAREGSAWLESRLGELRTQMNLATQIAQEFRARHDYRVGRQLGAVLADGRVVSDENAGESSDGPTLEELEVTADTYRKMYESFLQAFTSSANQQLYPVADARVITPASRPLEASHPRSNLVHLLGAVAGLMAGVAFAFVRSTFDGTVRSRRQLEDRLDINCLGELPPARRLCGFGRFDEIAKHPGSDFSESLRRVKAAISLADPAPIRVIGVTSVWPGDGKSSVASNLAISHAMWGTKTLLIDADARHSALTKAVLRPRRDQRSADFRSELDPIRRHIRFSKALCLDVLPKHAWGRGRMITPAQMESALKALNSYEIIIVDLPPLASGFDELAISTALDGVVIVAEWGKTPESLITELVRVLRSTKTELVGIVLTKVRSQSARRHLRRGSRVAR
ncbi:GNVR domain-containing protein [Aurantimonas sp. A2-1-M11]|uniref:GNVR domain-containing protein n=1 Tax=Aurantimonas sp. A2-1-M11 TaxID=3113712 RepID=UPI002F959864